MTGTPGTPEGELLAVGDEQVWHFERPTAELYFARGPAVRGRDPEARLTAALSRLAPTVTAARWGTQIHGRVIASVAAEPGSVLQGACSVGRCDGLVTDERGLGLLVWTADCVPVLIDGGFAVAAVHAGWRGVAAGIVQRAVRRLQAEYGVPAGSLTVFLGPAIGPDHYPVGPEVVAALDGLGVPRAGWLAEGDRVDLRSLVAALLHDAGVSLVVPVGGCTACDSELASYRRDGGRAGRQWSLIARRR